ncbi:VOC family protein [Oceaniserpentilla sp. 4NH20-0058]|uniref:VOC family protein n=1 Tax=Oceaniserpentilla sp. 4NH20-0058 TaxID=3127660 RepID=UPI00310A4E7B
MFSHMMLGANDIDASKKFYDAILAELGHKPGILDPKGRVLYPNRQGSFLLTKPIDGNDANHGNGSTLGFAAASPEQVNAWFEAGLKAGGTECEDAPGIRSGGGINLYLAYLRDPSGNKICASHRVMD